MLAAMADVPVRILKMAAGGDALGRLPDGRVVFVPGALPGELVHVSVTSEKKDFARGRAVAIVEPSPFRVAPPCPHLARGCGGCSWQHADPGAQLAWKADVVVDALRRTARLPDALVSMGGAADAWHYRTTMRLAVAPDGRVGLRAAASHRVVDLPSCMVAHPLLADLLPHLRVTGADELSIRVSVATGAGTAFSPESGARITGLPEHVSVGATASIVEAIAGAHLRVSAASFFQSGPSAAEVLVSAVRDACGEALTSLEGPLLDAYGGIGLFAATLGVEAAIVVEGSPSACDDARHNLGDRADVVHTRFERWHPRPVQLAIADPARAGLGKEAVAVLAATGARRVVLVSCDPVSLARDTSLLAAHGYSHGGSTVLDLFPHTPHVEVVTRFDRA